MVPTSGSRRHRRRSQVVSAATLRDLREVVKLVGELRAEILQALDHEAVRFDPAETAAERADFLGYGDYLILMARSPRGNTWRR